MGLAIGIDLGTTYSAAAHVHPVSGKSVIVPNAEGESLTPSVIWFGGDAPVVGRNAKAQQKAGECDTVSFFKRGMGDPYYFVEFQGQSYTPIDLSALVLTKIRKDCEAVLKEKVTDAVITVPAYFTDAQRKATIAAGEQAGLKVLRIINEPTAAALAYGVGQAGSEETVLVYDLGGGTFDVTLVRFRAAEIEVIATDGDFELGGKDWDDRIVQYLASRFREEFGSDPLDMPESSGELLVLCEEAKRMLTSRPNFAVAIDHEGKRGKYEVTREKFEELSLDLLQRTARLCEQVLRDAQLDWHRLDAVLLVGGSSNMPMVANFIEKVSGKPPRAGVPKDLAVALGAGIQAAMDARSSPTATPAKAGFLIAGERRVHDVISHSLGVVIASADALKYINSIIVPKNKRIPCTETRPFQFRTRARGENVLDVYLTQGELDDPTLCKLLGLYKFSDITHVQGSQAVLDIRYGYDTSGVVTVSATERSTGKALPMHVDALAGDMTWLRESPKAQQKPVHATIYLVVDVSGSMCGQPLQQAQIAARKFVSETDLANASVGLVAFADKTKITAPACQNARTLEAAIADLPSVPVGGSNEANPIADLYRTLKTVDDPRFVVLLTDGVWEQQSAAASEAAKCKAEGIEIVAIGFGSADHGFLKRIATTDEHAMMTNMGGLVEAFGTIAQAITEQAGQGSLKIKR